jgi:16S rRNA (uracil1498-N3)-methyltransferase
MLEKATELGIRDIQPLIMDRSIKRDLNIDRSINLIQTAAKQSMRSRFPKINIPVKLKELLSQDGRFICANIGETNSLSDINFRKNEKITIIIGPEGDFSDHEMQLMQNNRVQFYNLGKRRLRSETAALNSLSVLNELLG